MTNRASVVLPCQERQTAWTDWTRCAGGPSLPLPDDGAVTGVVAVREICPSGAIYAPGPLPALVLYRTLSGCAEVSIGRETLTCRPGTLLAIASGCEISERVGTRQPWRVDYLLLSGAWADGTSDWLRRHGADGALATETAPADLQDAFAALVDLALAEGPGWQWAFLGHLAALLGGLYAGAAEAAPGASLARRLAQILDDDPRGRPSVATLAGRLGLSPRQLLYQFAKTTGEPLGGWIRRRRIAAARVLLTRGQSVAAVAERLGYADPYHFSHAFKSTTGLAPSEVRRAALHGLLHAVTTPSDGTGG